MKYMCAMCGWIYDEETGDPENGIAPGTKFFSSHETHLLGKHRCFGITHFHIGMRLCQRACHEIAR